MNHQIEELLNRFKMTCRKCGSENVVGDIEPGTDWGGQTGCDSALITFGCNDCKANDYVLAA